MAWMHHSIRLHRFCKMLITAIPELYIRNENSLHMFFFTERWLQNFGTWPWREGRDTTSQPEPFIHSYAEVTGAVFDFSCKYPVLAQPVAGNCFPLSSLYYLFCSGANCCTAVRPSFPYLTIHCFCLYKQQVLPLLSHSSLWKSSSAYEQSCLWIPKCCYRGAP